MNDAYRKFIDEVREVMRGRRGWVSLKKSRAAECGVTHEVLKMVATAGGLEVQVHGKYGYIATKPIGK